MKLIKAQIASYLSTECESELTFATNNSVLASYIANNYDKEFDILVRKELGVDLLNRYVYAGPKDGLSAKITAIDELHAVGNHEMKVIFNPPATILFKDGKKYVSKAHYEEFDEEKGLLMCLAKANGISHLELKRMIKNAKRPKEEC